LELRDLVSGMRVRQNLLETVQKMLGAAVIVATETAQLLQANAAGELLLRTGQGLLFRNGRIIGATAGDTARLHKLLRDTVRLSRGHAASSGFTVKLARLGSRPLLVYACPVPGSLELSGAGAALLFISDPEQSVVQRLDMLRAFYGLTTAQVRLLYALLEGDRIKTYALKHGLSVNTVKSHLKQIFAKTGYGRQTDLVRGLIAHPLLRGMIPTAF
ncbi:MAG: helix-turn-helix transcriptional regulator, partial [Candidatus Dormibacteria bacterium]